MDMIVSWGGVAEGRKREGRGVQSIEVGAKLLYALVEESEPMMLKHLAKLAGIAPAQAYAYLVSYRKLGIVEQDGAGGRYRLGPLALQLGIARMRTFDPLRMASQLALDLSRDSAMNVAVVVWGSFGPTVVQLEESGSQLNMNTRAGTVYSMTGTASGRVFSAFMPDGIVKEALRNERREDKAGERVGKSRFLAKTEIERIRRQGYSSIDIDPPVPGINAIAAPVLDHAGQLQFVMTMIGLDGLLETNADGKHVAMLTAATRDMSFQLGYRGQPLAYPI